MFRISNTCSELCKVVFGIVCDFLCTKYLRNHWTDLCQIHRNDVFGPSLGQVWMSRSRLPGTKKQGQSIPRESLNWYATNSHGKRAWSLLAACMQFMFGKTSLASSLECIFWISDSTFWRILKSVHGSKNVGITDTGKAKTVVMVSYRTSGTWRR